MDNDVERGVALMRGKKRDLSERSQAMGIALVTGNAREASRQTGVPARTIQEWTNDEQFAQLRARTRDEVASEWWGIAQQGFRRVQELLGSTTDVAKAATATAIITDKMLVIMGEATSRYETRDLTNTFDDHELDLLRAAIYPAIPEAEAAVEDPRTNGATPT